MFGINPKNKEGFSKSSILKNLYEKADAIEDLIDWTFDDYNHTRPIIN